jgi:hypothetical protein
MSLLMDVLPLGFLWEDEISTAATQVRQAVVDKFVTILAQELPFCDGHR